MNNIRFANKNDIEKIMIFFDENWKKDHILARDRDFFEYQHLYGDEVSYVIAENENNELVGTLGYIPYDTENRDVMTVMWKTVHTDDSMLGIRLLQYLQEKGNVRSVSSPGINKKTVGIYQFMGYHVGMMEHWYRLNPNRSDFKIAKISEFINASNIEEELELEELETFEELTQRFDYKKYIEKDIRPYKSLEYINRRYYKHPKFKYVLYSTELLNTVLVFKLQECNGSRVLRLVDCIGDRDALQFISKELDRLMSEFDAEYVDLLVAGVDENILKNGGWINVASTNNIIPEYFNPYECKNVDIRYFSTDDKMVLFKADGDQDRPN